MKRGRTETRIWSGCRQQQDLWSTREYLSECTREFTDSSDAVPSPRVLTCCESRCSDQMLHMFTDLDTDCPRHCSSCGIAASYCTASRRTVPTPHCRAGEGEDVAIVCEDAVM
ncbi:hypothetical protein F2P81_017597 [Scophthalmus maximus]|uniref:Uncharacterized protein n=1 Tax=Scophthalmus maximus TaxID=52904 RepID=A0A6A4S6L3_SCOMX|nr:hypothetical protein F2P81_017597 [Scophthalmus maximus]